MKLKTSPSSPSLACRHMRYILPTLLLLAAAVASAAAAAEERVTLREPRPRQQARHHHPRRRQQELFGSGDLPRRDLNEDARNHHGFGNSTALKHANYTIGM